MKAAKQSSSPLDDATEAVERAERTYLAATHAVADVVDRFPRGMNDRRLIAQISASSGSAPDNTGLDLKQREAQQLHIDFHKAVAAETEARGALSRVQQARDDLQRAADLSALGDGRIALAKAVNGVREAERELAAVDTAYDTARSAVWAVQGDIDRATSAIDEAKAAAATHAVDVILGRADEAPKTVKQARTELQEIEDGLEAARAARAALEAHQKRLTQGLVLKRMSLDAAVKHVVKVHPSTRIVVTKMKALNRELAELRVIVDELRLGGMLPDSIDPYEVNHGLPQRSPWAPFIAALRTDPDAPLPKVA